MNSRENPLCRGPKAEEASTSSQTAQGAEWATHWGLIFSLDEQFALFTQFLIQTENRNFWGEVEGWGVQCFGSHNISGNYGKKEFYIWNLWILRGSMEALGIQRSRGKSWIYGESRNRNSFTSLLSFVENTGNLTVFKKRQNRPADIMAILRKKRSGWDKNLCWIS